MRPKKETMLMPEWSEKQLKACIRNKKTDETVRIKAQTTLEHNRKNYQETVENFFNPEKNKFWNLALWQLYREGKAKQYGVGEHKRFYISDVSLVFDKMVEIRRKISNFEVVKSDNTITKELHTWKR